MKQLNNFEIELLKIFCIYDIDLKKFNCTTCDEQEFCNRDYKKIKSLIAEAVEEDDAHEEVSEYYSGRNSLRAELRRKFGIEGKRNDKNT